MNSQLIAATAKRVGCLATHAQHQRRGTAILLVRTFQSSSAAPKSIVSKTSRRTKANHASCSKNKRHELHSSAPQEKSLAAQQILSATHTVPMPTREQLKAIFISSAVPMVGFGFMDNFIMIQAGGYIDSRFATFGLATMTAAAMGQVVSDVSGVLFGGTVERLANRIGWARPPAALTLAQRQLPICRNLALAGSVLGVALGCMLGACSLFFLPEEASKDAQERRVELQEIVSSMLLSAQRDGQDGIRCKQVAIYLAPTAGFGLRGEQRHDEASTMMLHSLDEAENDSLVAQCAESRSTLVADTDGVAVDTSDRPSSALCTPIVGQDGDTLGVLVFRNKLDTEQQQSSEASFTTDDERTARIMARHVSIFMERAARN